MDASPATPDERFASLPGYVFEPHYLDVPDGDGALRVHYIDEGPHGAAPVLLMHGEPSWSYLYRKMIPVITMSGYRAIAPDLVGFGRSDKPSKRTDYTYQRHVDWMAAFIEESDLQDVTLVGQDWGGLIGLRLVAEHPDRFARVVAANTVPPHRRPPAGRGFHALANYLAGDTDLSCRRHHSRRSARPSFRPRSLKPLQRAVSGRPYKEGARQFPLLVPTRPDDPASEANRAAWKALGVWEKPFLCAFSDQDPVTRGADRLFQKSCRGRKVSRTQTIQGGGHFLQEDKGEAAGKGRRGLHRRDSRGDEMSAIRPNPEQFQQLGQSAEKGAVVMLNLLKFKHVAEGEAGSGEDAYLRYGNMLSRWSKKRRARHLGKDAPIRFLLATRLRSGTWSR